MPIKPYAQQMRDKMKVYLEKIIKSLNDQEMNFAINKEHTIPFTCKLAILEGLSNNKDLTFPKAKFAFELLNLIKIILIKKLILVVKKVHLFLIQFINFMV